MSVSYPALGSSARAVSRLYYYGWVVVLVAALAMVGTLPARTQGLGLITEPLLRDLGIERITWAELNLWATLIGSTFAVGIGRILDRFGSRSVLTVVVLLLGSVVLELSRARSFASLAVGVTLTRGLGQSALSVVSIAMVGQWFVRRIDKAMAIYSVVMCVAFMLAFPLVGSLVQHWGWRGAWFAVGCALLLGLAPLGWALVRRGPEACGLLPDGDSRTIARAEVRADDLGGHSWGAALATPAFWVFALGAALYGLVASGIGLFNEAILAERGFDHEVYYATLAVTALTTLLGNFLGGWLAGRVPLARLLSAAMFVLAAGLAALPFVTAFGQVMVWAVAMGLGGGLVMVLFFSVWPRFYGRRQLGRIQGSAQAITVLASALGPLVIEWNQLRTHSYRDGFLILAAAIAVLGAAALFVSLPQPAPAVAPETDRPTSA